MVTIYDNQIYETVAEKVTTLIKETEDRRKKYFSPDTIYVIDDVPKLKSEIKKFITLEKNIVKESTTYLKNTSKCINELEEIVKTLKIPENSSYDITKLATPCSIHNAMINKIETYLEDTTNFLEDYKQNKTDNYSLLKNFTCLEEMTGELAETTELLSNQIVSKNIVTELRHINTKIKVLSDDNALERAEYLLNMVSDKHTKIEYTTPSEDRYEKDITVNYEVIISIPTPPDSKPKSKIEKIKSKVNNFLDELLQR